MASSPKRCQYGSSKGMSLSVGARQEDGVRADLVVGSLMKIA